MSKKETGVAIGIGIGIAGTLFLIPFPLSLPVIGLEVLGLYLYHRKEKMAMLKEVK